jgi:Nucleotide-diphospho-sugar transferase
MNDPFARPFPLSWFHPRCRAPLALRLGAVAEYLLSRHKQERLPSKKNGTLNYVTMAGRSHWLLLRESLVSLHHAWHSIPKLTVVSDGSWTRNDFEKTFDFWPNAIRVLMPEEILEPLGRAGQEPLVKLAKAHPLGLKLAAIVFQARESEMLFVDSDILWFSDPAEILLQFKESPGPGVAVETGSSYNEELVRQFCPEGLPAPGINTGCVCLNGELCEKELFEKLLATALKNPGHVFNEQSIIALAAQKNGRRLPAKFCLVDYDDAHTVKRRQPWREGFHSRHYVNWMRHQFYRDARTLRRKPILVS